MNHLACPIASVSDVLVMFVCAMACPGVPVHDDVPCTVELDRDDAIATMEPAHGPYAFTAASHGGAMPERVPRWEGGVADG